MGRGGQGNSHAPLRDTEDSYKATSPSGRWIHLLSPNCPVWRATVAQRTPIL